MAAETETMVVAWTLLASVAAAAAPSDLTPGASCELAKPLQVSEERARGKKSRIDRESVVVVLEIDRGWANVRGDWDEGWVKLSALRKRCPTVTPPAPKTTKEATPKAGEAIPASTAPEPLEALNFGTDRSGGPMTPQAPEGTHVCAYTDRADCAAQCRAGHAESCYWAAEQVRASLSTPPEPAEHRRVANLYTKACNRGHAEACARLGEMYELGEGLPVDDRITRRLFTQACDGGAARACAHLGYIHLQGEGVPVDRKRAKSLYGRGCEARNAQACAGLGALVLEGVGEPPNPTAAAELFRSACELDPREGAGGCARLGYLLEVGEGVVPDLEQAKTRYLAGCAGADAYACERLDALGIARPPALPPPGAPSPTSGVSVP